MLLHSLQQLISAVQLLSYSPINSSVLIDIDRYGAFGSGLNIFFERNPETGEIYSKEPYLDQLKSRFFTSYILEMYTAFACVNKNIFIDNTHLRIFQSPFHPHTHQSMNKMYNFYNSFSTKKNVSLSSVANILLPIVYEQIDLQDSYESHFNRFYKIYGSNEEINDLFYAKFNISIKKYIAISWGLLGFIYEQREFSLDQFIRFMASTTITSTEIIIFLNLISLTREEFKEKYLYFRKYDNGQFLDWEDRESVDKALPKVSYFFPLIRTKDKYCLISYTAIREFMKFKGLYRNMTLGLIDQNFKQRYSGPLFEAYVRALVTDYNDSNKLKANISGDGIYHIKKGHEKREPDTIFETDDYIIFVECKTSPFSLNLVKYLHSDNLKQLEDSIQTSSTNIDTYINFHRIDSNDKKIIKIVVFFEGIHMAFTMLKSDIKKFSKDEALFVMDIESLELLFSEYTKPIPEILEGFLMEDNSQGRNLNGYIQSTLKNKKYLNEENEILHKIVREELGLHVD